MHVTGDLLATSLILGSAGNAVMTVGAHREHLLPRLLSMDPRVREQLAAGMLGELQELAGMDPSFLQLLGATPFVPTESGDLRTPAQIYDPRHADSPKGNRPFSLPSVFVKRLACTEGTGCKFWSCSLHSGTRDCYSCCTHASSSFCPSSQLATRLESPPCPASQPPGMAAGHTTVPQSARAGGLAGPRQQLPGSCLCLRRGPAGGAAAAGHAQRAQRAGAAGLRAVH